MPENKDLLPEVIVFAGPNGSGKSTITRLARTVGSYINADDIKRTNLCSDMEAALKAEELREFMLDKGEDFTFETVLSTDRNLKLLKKAKEKGYFVRGIYDNTKEPFRIFKKRKDIYFHWENSFWNKEDIKNLTGVSDYEN